MSEINPRIQQVIDRQDISDVMIAYCRGVDRLDIELFRRIFWEDGGYECADGTFVSAAAEDFPKKILHETLQRLYAVTQHFVTNARFDFVDSSVAHTELYFYAFHRSHPTRESLESALGASCVRQINADPTHPHDVIVGGRYLDTFEKRKGVWRIKKRRLAQAWTSAAEASEHGTDGAMAAFGWPSSRSKSDPSYSW